MDDTPPTPPPQPGYQPPMPPGPFGPISAEEKQMAMWCHLASFAMYLVPFGNILGPLILWLTKRETMPFVDQEGKESLNFQISVTIYLLVSLVLTFLLCIGLPLVIAACIFQVVYVILAAIEVSKGNSYKYPLCIRFIN